MGSPEETEDQIEREDAFRAEINQAFDSSNFRAVVVDLLAQMAERCRADGYRAGIEAALAICEERGMDATVAAYRIRALAAAATTGKP